MNEEQPKKILVVDDEQASLNAINRTLRREFDIILSLNGQSALEVLKDQQVAVILADQRMPGMAGVDFFQEALKIQPEAVRILITGYTDIDATIDAINQAQIFYYIGKPWEPDELRLIVRRAAERYELVRENRRLMEELKEANANLQEENIILHREAGKQYEFENIVGQSRAMQEVFQFVRKVIPIDTTILLLGETGTGKELIARAIHYNGPRKNKLFVAQNCAALPDTLLESELFGHVKGAFTGATQDKKGLFELADEGTIFLDEIGDTSPALQQRLLRVLQEGEIRPVGSEKSIYVDVRIISATNQNLEQAIRTGRFREDLYYRLNVFPIRIPPLRERREDIPLLAEHFVIKYSRKSGKKIAGITTEALKILMAGSYPGNVRELENEIERAVALAESGSPITADLLSPRLKGGQTFLPDLLQEDNSLKEITESIEKYYITEKLKQHKGNITHTAEDLGLSRVGLQKKIQRYGLEVKRPSRSDNE
ncbi:MAG: sigma-54 dependent transcriptional regulator [Calditrichia bacterium]